MLRAVIGVIVGYAVWTVIWLGGGAVFFGRLAESVTARERYEAVGPLVGLLALSIACSLAGGMVCGLISRGRTHGASMVLATLLLVTGIGVQAGVWSLMPVWYHLVFLVLLIPVTMLGGMLTPKTNPARR